MCLKNLKERQLEKIYNGVSFKMENLQKKMKNDILSNGGCVDLPYYDIHPRNFSLIDDIGCCSLHDLQKLEELADKRFNVFWILEKKKAVRNGCLDDYDSMFVLYSIRNYLNNNDWSVFYDECLKRAKIRYGGELLTHHAVLWMIKEHPNVLNEILKEVI